ncbi:MAG: DUF2089 domain-containing protein [Chloroflexi bacterium]|jgi:hypothetical protein|nr:DUF2089 domain-containing protein [Anaerolineaceae bacterium]NMB90055.1 DUF2089 domain-containing protein [Chloroflexota bacterium]
MYSQPRRCPVCGGQLSVTRLHCPDCDTSIEGHFIPAASPFAQLSPEQEQFVLNFVRLEGRLNRMEDEMRMSYPTLRNRLHEIIRALGYEPGREETPARPGAEERQKILDDLAQQRITAAEAQRLLRGRKNEEE